MQYLINFNMHGKLFENWLQIQDIPTLEKRGNLSIHVLELDEKDLYPIRSWPIDNFSDLKPISLEWMESFLFYKLCYCLNQNVI